MYDVNSAECLKNIILHLNNILSLDAIQAEYARKQEPQERDDDILTYDPDDDGKINPSYVYHNALKKTKGEENAIVVIMQALKNGLLRL